MDVDLFYDPFDMDSACHRSIAQGAEAGIPGGTTDNRDYDDPGPVNSRGRLAVVSVFRTGRSKQGRKWTKRVSPSDPSKTIKDQPGAPTDNLLPFTLRMPGGEYPDSDGDDDVQLWPRDGSDARSACSDLFFNYNALTSTAKRRYQYPLDGKDVPGSDDWSRGSSASGLRWPATVLRGKHINPKSPAPLQYPLNCTATRHSNQGAAAKLHVLSKKRVWPAIYTDGSADQPGQNTGDLPYGTRLFIRWQDRGLRGALGLSPRGLVLFDCLLQYGCYILDGQGQTVDGGAVLQVRLDHEVTDEACDDLDKQLMKLLPHIYPLRDPRPVLKETERCADGFCYAGMGKEGAKQPGVVNTAWNAPTKPVPPDPEPEPEPEPGETVACPICGSTLKLVPGA